MTSSSAGACTLHLNLQPNPTADTQSAESGIAPPATSSSSLPTTEGANAHVQAPAQSNDLGLTNSHTTTITAGPSQTSRRRFFWYRLSLRLIYFRGAYFRRHQTEPKKIALFSSRALKAIDSLIHILAIGICIGLSFLSFRGYFVGRDYVGIVGQTTLKLLGFQLAAKTVELVVLTSLASTIADLVRYMLKSRKGAPFAMITASSDFSHMSYLWSPELWSLWSSTCISKCQRTFLFITLACCGVLAVVIGPAVAVLIQPRMDWWDAGGTTVWMNNTQEMFLPRTLDISAVPQLDCDVFVQDACPGYGWESIENWLDGVKTADVDQPIPGISFALPNSGLSFSVLNSAVSPTYKLRTLYWDNAASDSAWMLPSWIVVPNAAVARGLNVGADMWLYAVKTLGFLSKCRLWFYNDVKYYTDGKSALTPVVNLYCATGANYTNASILPCTTFYKMYPEPSQEEGIDICSGTDYENWLLDDFRYSQEPRVHWIDDQTQIDPNPSGLWSASALVTFPAGPQTTVQGNASKSITLIGCSISSNYTSWPISRSKFVNDPATAQLPDRMYMPDWLDDPYQGLAMSLKTDWLNMINPSLSHGTNNTVFGRLVQSAEAWGFPIRYAHATHRIEWVLLFMIANGLARVNPYAVARDTIRSDWMDQIIPSEGHFWGSGRDAFNLTLEDKRISTPIGVKVSIEGYAYSYVNSVGILSSIAIVLFFCLLSLVILCIRWFVLRDDMTSMSWKSSIELIALALASSPPTHEFQNTSAGIWAGKTLRQSVRIQPQDDALNLVATDGDRDEHASVGVDKEY